jgi:hypothetical protein
VVERARGVSAQPAPRTRDEALELLTHDTDATVAALAKLHAAAASGNPARVVIGSRERTPVELALERGPRLATKEA